MGRWGDAPFESDAALDVRDSYMKLRSAGMRPADAVRALQEREIVTHALVLPESLLALAALLAEAGELGGETARHVLAMPPPGYDEPLVLCYLGLTLATAGCLTPGLAKVIQEAIQEAIDRA
jgi:hypothetical protein